MIYYLIFFLVYLGLNIAENYYREVWKYGKIKEQVLASRIWHSVQSIRWGLMLILAVIIIFNSYKYLVILLPSSAIWKILFDGFLNIARGRNFWYQSPHTNLSFWEKYSTKTNKIIFLILTILIFIIVEVLC